MNNNNKQQKLIAAAVMGMNFVNTLSPVAALAANPVKAVPQQAEQPKQEAKPLEYMSLPQILQAVEVVVFTEAEAAEYIVNDGDVEDLDKMADGDKMIINSGGKGTVFRFTGGAVMEINDGGYGSVGADLHGGTQIINNGGSGDAGAANQIINNGGKGYIEAIWPVNEQIINEGGIGYAGAINDGGGQTVNGGKGFVNAIADAGGRQSISAGYGSAGYINGGAQYINGGTGTVANLSAGIYNQLGRQHVLGGTALDTVINGGVQMISNGAAHNTTLNYGAIANYNADAKVSGVTMKGGTYTLNADGGTYKIDGDFNFTGGSFDMAKKLTNAYYVDDLTTGFIQTHTYETVNINNLTGSGGNFIFNTDLATDTYGDKITITNAAPGTNAYVQISDESKFNNTTVTGNHALLLIKDESGNATFTGKDLNEGGFFTLTPKVEKGTAIGKAENEWYLTHVTKKINNDTQVIIESMDNAYALWCNTKDSLRKRMGERQPAQTYGRAAYAAHKT